MTEGIQYYYRFESIEVDYYDEKDFKKHNHPLDDFDILIKRFSLLQKSYEDLSKERGDITVCVQPHIAEQYVSRLIQISACHLMKTKAFSKKVTKNVLSLCISMWHPDGTNLYFYETTDAEEVKQIFYDYVKRQKAPLNLSDWEMVEIRDRSVYGGRM